jgi:hypothetical protein
MTMQSQQTAPERLESAAAARHHRVNWRQEYLHLAIILMTACWMASWVALTLNWLIDISLSTALGLVMVHLVGSMLLVRWMLYRRVNERHIWISTLLLMGAAAVITALLTPSLAKAYSGENRLTLANLFDLNKPGRAPAGPVVILWVLLLWRRGYQLGSAYFTLVRSTFGMRLGILAFFWALILASRSLRQDILSLVPFFFFFGLLGSSLARADSLSLDRSSRGTAFGRGWIPSLLGIALVLTLGGYVLAIWLSGMNLGRAAYAFDIFARVVLTLFFLILFPVLVLVEIVVDFLKDRLAGRFPQLLPDLASGGNSSAGSHSAWLAKLLEILSDAVLICLVVVIVLIIVAVIWFVFIARARRDRYGDEERESIGTGEVVSGLRQTLRDQWRRLAEMLGILRQFGLGRDLLTALTIRRIYAQMEKLAGVRGYPRALSETPYEYRRELGQAFPEQVGDVQLITEAYVAVRYGEVPEDHQELEVVRAAWTRVRSSPKSAP